MLHLDSNTWPLGLSWTKGFDVMVQNPNGSFFIARGLSGPFFFIQIPFGITLSKVYNKIKKVNGLVRVSPVMLEIYFGCKPTPDYDPKYDNAWTTRWIGVLFHDLTGYSNIGGAFRICHF